MIRPAVNKVVDHIPLKSRLVFSYFPRKERYKDLKITNIDWVAVFNNYNTFITTTNNYILI